MPTTRHRIAAVPGAFLDLSPAAASALGCRCTHRSVTATVVQLASGGTVVASRGRQRPVVAAALPGFFQPTLDDMGSLGTFGSSIAMAPAPRHRHREQLLDDKAEQGQVS